MSPRDHALIVHECCEMLPRTLARAVAAEAEVQDAQRIIVAQRADKAKAKAERSEYRKRAYRAEAKVAAVEAATNYIPDGKHARDFITGYVTAMADVLAALATEDTP